MCHCEYHKFSNDEPDDDACCCDFCCCNEICGCIRKTCCCCCKLTGCLFRFICTIISFVGFFLVIYIILAACTDNYFNKGIWRDQPFKYRGWSDDKKPYCDQCKRVDDIDKPEVVCDEGSNCTYLFPLYFYSSGGSGFLGAMFTSVSISGISVKYNGKKDIDLSKPYLLDGYTHLYEERTNKILFGIDFKCPDGEDIQACIGATFNLNKMEFTSIKGNFWDFMPMGPGDAFGIASSNKYYPCDSDDDEELDDHECIKSE